MRLTSAALLTVLLLAGCTGGSSKPTPDPTPTIKDVKVYPGLSHAHLKPGQFPQTYAQSPPVGGPHAGAWLKCAVYPTEVPKENAVHSEEHGGVWLTYLPALAATDVAKLAELQGSNKEFVLVSPYPGQAAPVIASTWGLQLEVQSADDPRLLEFIRTYAGGDQGGEKRAGCTSTGFTLEQVLAYDEQLK